MAKKTNKNIGGCPYPSKCGCLGVSFSDDLINNLGSTQRELLHYLVIDFMTVKQIANKRKTHISAVKNIIYKLRRKKLIDTLNRQITDLKVYQNKGGCPSTLPPPNDKGLFRLHSEHHTIKINGTSNNYLKVISKKSQLEYEGNIVMLYRRKLVIYSNKSFYDDVPNECFEKSSVYWFNLFKYIERDLNICVFKDSDTEIRRFKCHIAKTNDPLAKLVINHNLKYKYIDDLGRERLIIDNSKSLFEFEAICNETCQDDINIIRDYQGNLITKDHYLPSQAKTMIDITQGQLNELLLVTKALTITNKTLQEEVIKLKHSNR